ncbi:hypothetical protein BH18ACI1_BH18ACI1_11400 [soil metagenome]
MNNNETLAVRQPITASPNENLRCDLQQAVKIINTEYQQLDWEDQAFLNRVFTDALPSFEAKGGNLCQ